MEKKKRGRANRRLLVMMKDNEQLELVGIYTSTHHAEKHLGKDGIWNANIDKYINYKIDTLNGFIAVYVEIGSEPIDTDKIYKQAKILGKERHTRNTLLKLNAADISKLSTDQVLRIRAIVDENIKNENINTQNG